MKQNIIDITNGLIEAVESIDEKYSCAVFDERCKIKAAIKFLKNHSELNSNKFKEDKHSYLIEVFNAVGGKLDRIITKDIKTALKQRRSYKKQYEKSTVLITTLFES